jgi:hypothetical protein
MTAGRIISRHRYRRTARIKAWWLEKRDPDHQYVAEEATRGPAVWVVRRRP